METISWENLHDFMDEVRATARGLLRRERHAYSLQTTALVLTALRRQKLAQQNWDEVSWESREQFLAAMYRAMDRALKDHARRRCAKKRQARKQVPLEALSPEDVRRMADFQPHDLTTRFEDHPEIITALTDALTSLERHHPQWAWVAKHRYYGRLTVAQTAQVMGLGERTVRRYWEKARILLHEDILRSLGEPLH